METPARPTSLALAESQNIQPKGQVGGSGVQSAKSAMSDKASSGSSFGSSSAAAGGGSTPAAAITGAVGSSAEGKSSKAGRQAVGGGMGAAPPATPAVAPASRATADTGASAAGAAAAASFATPAAALTFATPAAPARPAGAGAAGEGARAEGEGGGGGGGGAEVATDRMILATPTSASTPATAEPARASSPARAAPPADAAAAAGPTNSSSAPVDDEAESLALARQLLEEEAMASYAAAVDIFRSSAAAAAAGGVGIEGVAAEDMAAMQALMEEDENNPGAFAMAEDESLDYDGMLELGSAIGDVKKDRWRMRCKAVIAALPRFTYAAGGSAGVEDTKCLVCQCDYEEGDELRRLPCSHVFHTGCVDGWLEQNEECPTCRQSVSPSSQG